MRSIYLCIRLALVGTSVSCLQAEAQQVLLSIVTPPGVSAPSRRAIDFLVSRTNELSNPPVRMVVTPLSSPPAFCTSLREQEPGVYVAPLSLYATCFENTPALRALDFPFLARDWRVGRELLMGPLGAAIQESLTRRNAVVLAFWDGETRIFSSSRPFVPSNQLRGRRVATLATPNFATGTAILEAGARPTIISADRMVDALSAGLTDTAESTLSFFSENLTGVQKSALLSNHSINPVIIVAPIKTLDGLAASQRGLLETLIRQATAIQVAENDRSYQANLERIRRQGITVSPWSDQFTAAFRTQALVNSSVANAQRTVFATSSPAIRDASISQIQGISQTSYWKTYFVTNRTRANQQLENGIGAGILYGVADVEFEFEFTSHIPGDPGSITYGRKGRGVVVDWNSVSTKPFPDALSRSPRSMPAKAPIVYVHGFANTPNDALRRSAWIGWNAKRPVVAFIWPSQGSANPWNYRTDQATADASINALASFLDLFGRNYDTATDIDIVVHSMGARVLLGALIQMELLSSQRRPPRFRQLVLVAPDVASKAFQKDWSGLRRFFERAATLYVSDHDLALGISRDNMNPSDGDRAGLAPPVLVMDQVESIFIGPNDFSFTGHSYHVANGVIADDILELLRYGVDATQRRGIGRSTTGKMYFELQRLRNP